MLSGYNDLLLYCDLDMDLAIMLYCYIVTGIMAILICCCIDVVTDISKLMSDSAIHL